MKRVGLVVIAAATACGSAARRFPLREPFARDTDLDPVSVACRPDPSPKEPKRVTCAPEEYVSPFVWDRIENTVFGRLSRILSIEEVGEAANANSLDEVADSAWFQHRTEAVMTPDQRATGACKPDDLLPADVADGAWVIDHGKDNGSTVGFRVKVPGKGLYLLKADEPDRPERSSAASVIGAAFYHAAGFHTSCEQIVYIRRAQLRLEPGLVTVSNDGSSHPFDDAALTKAFETLPQKGNTRRMQASKWLPGVPLGPFRYERTRADDPNDIIPHEDRRELRGGKLLAAWLNHWDAREQNSLDTWIAKNPADKRSSPGFVRHYIIDTSDVFGQPAEPRTLEQRLGHSYDLDFRDILVDFVTLGMIRRPWDRAAYVPGHEIFGYFVARDFDPTRWKGAYPNPAFLRMTERDAAWMARIIARFSTSDIRAIVTAGQFSDASHVDYLTQVLIDRQAAILRRYLARLSPIADVRREPAGQLCGLDLARLRGAFLPDRFRYQIVEEGANRRIALAPEVRAGGVVCWTPQSIAPAGLADDAPGRVVVFRVDNGTGAGPLEIHTYDLGPTRGMRVVGLVRRERN